VTVNPSRPIGRSFSLDKRTANHAPSGALLPHFAHPASLIHPPVERPGRSEILAGRTKLPFKTGFLYQVAPDITTAIVNGRRPQQLSAKTLMRKASRLPVDWA
jgi:hypothetical protein